jgi:hypothetical protein
MSKSDIKSIIGSVLGAEDERDVDFNKGYSKYVNMKDIAIRYINLFKFLANSKAISELEGILENVKEFLAELEKNFTECFTYDTAKLNRIHDKYPFVNAEENEEILKFTKKFNLVKKSNIVKYILDTCNNLITYKNNLSDINTLSDKFITRYAGNNLHILPHLSVNIKFVYLGSDDGDKKILLLFLHKLYTIAYLMYEEYGKPDINMDNFVKAIEIAIKDLRGKIPRCDQAFKIIEDSSKMLESNYPTYYKDYVSTNNSMIIAENFIQDVANNVSTKSPKVAFQFRRIITELKRMASRASTLDPKYKEMINVLSDTADTNFDSIKKQENLSEEECDDCEDSDEDVTEKVEVKQI